MCACVRRRGRDLLASDYWIVASKLFYSKFIIAQFKTGTPFAVYLLPYILEGLRNKRSGGGGGGGGAQGHTIIMTKFVVVVVSPFTRIPRRHLETGHNRLLINLIHDQFVPRKNTAVYCHSSKQTLEIHLVISSPKAR